MSEKPTRILCLGGGWASIYFVAQMQSAIKKKQVEVTVVSKDNFHTFHGFIGEMLVGRVQPSQIVSAARRIFPNTRFYNADIESIDVKSQTVTTSRKLDGRQYVLEYDQLFVAIGSVDDLSRYPGIAEHALKLKTYWDCFKAAITSFRCWRWRRSRTTPRSGNDCSPSSSWAGASVAWRSPRSFTTT